jgi:hypothetical protein
VDLNDTIRPWLVICGRQFGAKDAFRYRCPDESAQAERPYFTYRLDKFAPENIGKDNASSIVTPPDGHDVNVRARQKWIATVQIDLHHHEFGDEILAACDIAAQRDNDIRNRLASKNAVAVSSSEITDMTEWDADRVYYHFRMLSKFRTWAVFDHEKTNYRVTDVDIDDAFSID